MCFERYVGIRNLKRHPARTAVLVLIAAFLSLSVFGGSAVTASLKRGLAAYESRLGADIVAVPFQARTKGAFEDILLQGIPGMFYMDEKDYEKIKSIEGVERTAPQFYLASTSSGCCSAAVQIIGFDPGQDFTVQPWIRESYADTLGDGDILVGCELTVPKDHTLTFYDTDCRIVGQLDRTGTGLDTAVYANMNTIRDMIQNAQALGFTAFDDIDPDHAVSSVMIQVADGYDVDQVTGDINIYVRHIEASAAVSMISEIASGLSGTERLVGVLAVMIWLLAVVVMGSAFLLISFERKKEFAVLRMMGVAQGRLMGLMLWESGLITAVGAVCGVLTGALFLYPFQALIRMRLQLPFLMPDAGRMIFYALGAIALSVISGMAASAFSAWRINREDAGTMLREDV